jgi:cytosine/adenosine deaminase-related metal-dependent hydrolase
LEALFSVADGIVASGLPAEAGREIHRLAEERHKLRCLPCPSPRFAEALESFAPQWVSAQAGIGDAEIAALAAARLPVVVTPRADASRGLPLPPIGALLRAGVPLMLGTGSAMHNAPNLFAEMDFAWKIARLQAGAAPPPPPAAILRMVTGNVRAVLGGACHGALERGLPADFVVLDFRHPHLCGTRDLLASIVSRVTPDDVVATYLHGVPVWRLPDFNP